MTSKGFGKRWNLNDLTEEQLSNISRENIKRNRKHNKYNRSSTEARTYEGIIFDSKKEMKYYQKLTLTPTIHYFLRQVPFYLPGGVKYVCDFLVFYKDGSHEFIDVKGFRTPTYKMKKKMVESLYPVKIKEV